MAVLAVLVVQRVLCRSSVAGVGHQVVLRMSASLACAVVTREQSNKGWLQADVLLESHVRSCLIPM
jgi:hypothetical protein